MKIQVWWIGKTQVPYVMDGINDFSKRIRHLEKFSTQTLLVKSQKDPVRQRATEGQVLLERLQPGDQLVLLDEKGKELSSRSFARFLEKMKMNRTKNLVFAIGGSHGFDEQVRVRANHILALSKMTFPHDLVRLIFLEQLYRSITINLNHPYHHD